jgi:hypothetical protein
LLARTPLRVGSATVWADPETGTVRFGTPTRNRTLLAGLIPTSYLVGMEHEVLVTAVGSDEALSFSLNSGVSAAIGPYPKPNWLSAVEATLKEPMLPVRSWVEVGVRRDPTAWYCSIPVGKLPQLQSGLVRQGLQMAYITHIQMAKHDEG